MATAVDHACVNPERAARQLGNTREVAKTHYIDVPETVPRQPRRSGSLGERAEPENVRFL
ncbi:hypothetical protein [Nocardia beijingensis]